MEVLLNEVVLLGMIDFPRSRVLPEDLFPCKAPSVIINDNVACTTTMCYSAHAILSDDVENVSAVGVGMCFICFQSHFERRSATVALHRSLSTCRQRVFLRERNLLLSELLFTFDVRTVSR